MPRIIDIVRARRNAIEGNPQEAERTGALGVAALVAGLPSPEWDAYIAHLGEFTPAQLARLRAEDNTAGDVEMDKKRVYVVANGMCGINSPNTQNLPFRVNSIDAGFSEVVCDPEA
jgi:hypothetical protein